MFERSRKGERALLLQPRWVSDSSSVRTGSEELDEFSELARSAGATVVGALNARIRRAKRCNIMGTSKNWCRVGAAHAVRRSGCANGGLRPPYIN